MSAFRVGQHVRIVSGGFRARGIRNGDIVEVTEVRPTGNVRTRCLDPKAEDYVRGDRWFFFRHEVVPAAGPSMSNAEWNAAIMRVAGRYSKQQPFNLPRWERFIRAFTLRVPS